MPKKVIPNVSYVVIGLVISILLILLHSINLFSPVVSALSSVGITYQGQSYGLYTSLQDQLDFFSSLSTLQAQNSDLVEENKLLLAANSSLTLEADSVAKIEKQLQFDLPYELVGARVIFYDPTHPGEIVINKGTSQGLNVSDTVILDNFLLGSITEVRAKSAKVELITATGVQIPSIIVDKDITALAAGQSNGQILLDKILITQDVAIDDLVVTAGLNSIHPRGLIIGVVTKVDVVESELTKSANLSNPIEFNKLDEVFIIID